MKRWFSIFLLAGCLVLAFPFRFTCAVDLHNRRRRMDIETRAAGGGQPGEAPGQGPVGGRTDGVRQEALQPAEKAVFRVVATWPLSDTRRQGDIAGRADTSETVR